MAKNLPFLSRTEQTRDDWRTPPSVLAAIEHVAGERIAYDSFCTPENAVATPIHPRNCMLGDWPTDGLIFANPPYGAALAAIAAFMADQVQRNKVRLVVLVPSSTGSTWWHVLAQAMPVSFFLGRVQFVDPAQPTVPGNSNHNSCLFYTEHYTFPRSISVKSIRNMRRKHT
jgi:phage N-6-adenine-methyltransferase